MPLDTRIPLMAAQPRRNSLTEQYGQAMQMKVMQQQIAAQEKALTDSTARKNALKTAWGPEGLDYEAAQQALVGLGDVEGAVTLRGQALKEEEAKAAQQSRRIKADMEKVSAIAQLLGGAKSQEEWDSGLRRIQSMGITPDDVPPTWTPEISQRILEQAMDAKTRLQMGMEREKFGETKRHNEVTEKNSAANAAAMNAYRRDRLNQGDRANDIAAQGVNFKNEQAMADDHRAQSKNFIEVRDAFTRVKGALKTATTSAPATLTAATSFMKLLDPGSVVRESELGMALAATGAFDRMSNYFNQLQNGQVLTPSQAREFEDIAKRVYAAAEKSQQQLDRDYRTKAGRYGLNTENVVTDYYSQPEAPPAPPVEGAMQAPDGHWYVKQNGQTFRVDP